VLSATVKKKLCRLAVLVDHFLVAVEEDLLLRGIMSARGLLLSDRWDSVLTRARS
jgi:hypothetical protein